MLIICVYHVKRSREIQCESIPTEKNPQWEVPEVMGDPQVIAPYPVMVFFITWMIWGTQMT